tara:strand:- start:1077 stop:1790 length:714 start_codon:yes stop_codon:yes gene_type:complete
MKKEIKFKFFTKNNGVSKGIYKSLNCGINSKDDHEKVISNIAIAANSISKKNKKIIIPTQLHSNKCLLVKNLLKEYKCDALVTNRNDIILGITTADCIPIILYDSKSSIIGICHAGWRGLFSGVIQNTIKKMRCLGSHNKDINLVIGPCIRKKSYEVSEEFINELIPKYRAFSSISRDKYYFDLPQLAAFIAVECGILKIHDMKQNTYTSNNYFSYRESKKKKFQDYGRNINMISIN